MARPTSVTVFAVIHLILGGLGVLGMAWALVLRLGLFEVPGAKDNPAMKLMAENKAYALYSDIMTGLGILAVIAILAGSVAMLQLKPWGRLVTIGWGCYGMLSTVVGTALNHVVIMKPLAEQAHNEQERIGIMVGTYGAIVVAVLFMVYYALMIGLLSRAKVRLAFEQQDELMEPAL